MRKNISLHVSFQQVVLVSYLHTLPIKLWSDISSMRVNYCTSAKQRRPRWGQTCRESAWNDAVTHFTYGTQQDRTSTRVGNGWIKLEDVINTSFMVIRTHCFHPATLFLSSSIWSRLTSSGLRLHHRPSFDVRQNIMQMKLYRRNVVETTQLRRRMTRRRCHVTSVRSPRSCTVYNSPE